MLTPNWTNEELLIITQLFLEEVTGELDPYVSEKGVIKILNDKSVSLELPSHIQFAKYGRGPGKKPPFDEILEWVKKENIQFENSTQEGTAFAIQKSIGENGTLNYVPGAPDALEEALQKYWLDYQKDLSKQVILQVNSEVNRIYKQIDYSQIVK